MQLLQQTQDATNERKFMKSQMEKRRRERMNHSLQRLRTMLLQEPQQLGTQHRVEKAEILEHAVLFLQKKTRTSPASSFPDDGDEGRGQKHCFRDAFSSCLRTAARFLDPDGKGPRLRGALDASVAARFCSSDPAAGVRRRPEEARWSSGSLSHTKSILRTLRGRSGDNPRAPRTGASEPCGGPIRNGSPGFPVPPPKSSDTESPSSETSEQTEPDHTLWRPWP
uniref:BHLH domain-containing protein n=1 Tax=Gasterosteus aculeatus aculeatus TaxID=481459 RepID=A0AAQ4PNM3_GASAC|nr:transcription factor HES-5-like isoform X2 [Gasterosteus aculeatus aculeatus]